MVLSQDGMSVKEIESLFKHTSFVGFPIVVSQESQYLYGYILKRDLKMAFGIIILYLKKNNADIFKV